jgi:hypothetical protein
MFFFYAHLGRASETVKTDHWVDAPNIAQSTANNNRTKTFELVKKNKEIKAERYPSQGRIVWERVFCSLGN